MVPQIFLMYFKNKNHKWSSRFFQLLQMQNTRCFWDSFNCCKNQTQVFTEILPIISKTRPTRSPWDFLKLLQKLNTKCPGDSFKQFQRQDTNVSQDCFNLIQKQNTTIPWVSFSYSKNNTQVVPEIFLNYFKNKT